MATNDIFMKITKGIFKGNRGKELQLLRKKIEVLEFVGVPNTNQQVWIDAVNAEYDLYFNQVKTELNEETLEDIV